jgi:hypothetical protein
MDIDEDDMMIHQLRQDKSNAAFDDDEHLMILACLIQLQAGKLKNAALKLGGKSLGERSRSQCRGWIVMHFLYADHSAEEATYIPMGFW